ncbi:hypothetical protein AC249_AIPGENE20275 [Exaiptasia diaphana]|nr:hypothetical protein AC249_AIPGENE20275 [Exaiptasia diaphana]
MLETIGVKLPDVLRKFGAVDVFSVFECRFVLRESLFECSFCQSDVVLGSVAGCDLRVVDYTAVADFYVIFVEEAVVFMLVREVLRYEFQECSANVLSVKTLRRTLAEHS